MSLSGNGNSLLLLLFCRNGKIRILSPMSEFREYVNYSKLEFIRSDVVESSVTRIETLYPDCSLSKYSS